MAFLWVLATECSHVHNHRADSRTLKRLCGLLQHQIQPAPKYEVKLRLFDDGVDIAAEALDDRTGGRTNQTLRSNQCLIILRQDAPLPSSWRVARNLIVTPYRFPKYIIHAQEDKGGAAREHPLILV
jgi:hypothetical protein